MNPLALRAAERTCFEALMHSSGYCFSMPVQYAWCRRRLVNEGLLTLSVLQDDLRLSLLAAWMRSADADTLLDFMSQQLPDPSAELEMCRFEQFTRRAHQAAATCKAPQPAARLDERRVIQRADAAGLAFFHNEPALLVAPGLRSLCRSAKSGEKRLWARLLAPCRVVALLEEGFPREMIEGLLQVGALEFTC